jgi:hypothetical protein
MTMIRTSVSFKFPPGLAINVRVRANKRHEKAHKNTRPRGRMGTVIAPTANRSFVRIKWDGCVGDGAVHVNFFDVVGGEQ